MDCLSRAMERNPEAALRHSLSLQEWIALPEDIKLFTEEPFSACVDLDVLIECGPAAARIDRFVTLPDGARLKVHAAPGLRLGRSMRGVQAEGIRLGDACVLRSAVFMPPAAPEEIQAFDLQQTGEAVPRDMYVIPVDFDDRPGPPVDTVQLETVINTTVSQQIHDMSYGQSFIRCRVDTNTYRMPQLSSWYVSDHRPLYDHAVAAVQNAGIDLSSNETVCVFFTRIPGLTLAGYASIGGEKMWLHDTVSPYVILHELGHNYGSYHAHSWNVSGSDPVDPSGVHEEYGDILDIMGTGRPPAGHFHVQNKLEVQWLGPENVGVVTNSGTYRSYRGDHPLTDPVSARRRGLRMDKGGTNDYWVGYRQLFSEYESFGRGTYVLWQQPNAEGYPKSHLLDMMPGSAGGKQDGGLALGQTYSDLAAGIHLTPAARGGQTPDEWIDVTVNLGLFATNTPPSGVLTGPAGGMTRESITFAVEASDADGDELAYYWDFNDGLVHANHAQASAAWITPGTGTVTCTVSDMRGGTVQLQQDIVLADPLEEWPHQNTITFAFLYDIAEDGERAVTVGSNGFTATSTNGTDWVNGNVGGTFVNVTLYGMMHDGSRFIAVGRDWVSSAWAGVVYTSADGAAWTRRHEIPTFALNDVAAGNGFRVAVGHNGTILRSVNGLSWSPVAFASTNHLLGVSFGNGLFTAVGRTSAGAPAVFVSPDGFTWHDRTAAAGTGIHHLDSIEFYNNRTFAGGSLLGIRYSDDTGNGFSVATNGLFHLPAFACGGGIYFAAGINQGDGGADINLISRDGIAWTALPTAAQPNRNAAVYFKGGFITVGESGSVWRSDPVTASGSGWAMWQYSNRTGLGFDRDAFDDPDGDGVMNLIEYAVGSLAADGASVPAVSSYIDEAGYLVISLNRTAIAEDIDYIVERSADLMDGGSWSRLDTVVVRDLPSELAIRSVHPVAVQDQEFLRFKAEIIPPSP
jgi:PKD repeat protein